MDLPPCGAFDALAAICAVPGVGGGQGVVARVALCRGQRILAERPAVSCASQQRLEEELFPGGGAPALAEQEAFVAAAIERCGNADHVRRVWALHDASAGAAKSALGVFKSNAFATGDGARSLFLRACRLNHSCRPNAIETWVPGESLPGDGGDDGDGGGGGGSSSSSSSSTTTTGQLVVHALRDVAAGEELTIDYEWEGISCRGGDERGELLQRWMGFRCRCCACSLTGAPREASDARRRRMRQLAQSVEEWDGEDATVAAARAGLPLVAELLALLDAELDGHAAFKADACFAGFSMADAAGDDGLARQYVREAYAQTVLASGADNVHLRDSDEEEGEGDG
jgi:hypothetical protein